MQPRLPDQWRDTVRHAPVAEHRHGRLKVALAIGLALLAWPVIEVLVDWMHSGSAS